MVRRRPVAGQHSQVLGRAVARIALPSIGRVMARQGGHQAIAQLLRDDRGTGDGVALGVALDDVQVRAPERGKRVAVDQHVIGADRQPLERALHGQHGGVIDVEPVHLVDRRGPDTEGEGMSPDLEGEPAANGARELLRVVDPRDGAFDGRHDDRACDDGARERAPSDFIDAGDQCRLACAQVALDGAPPMRAARGHAGPTPRCFRCPERPRVPSAP